MTFDAMKFLETVFSESDIEKEHKLSIQPYELMELNGVLMAIKDRIPDAAWDLLDRAHSRLAYLETLVNVGEQKETDDSTTNEGTTSEE